MDTSTIFVPRNDYLALSLYHYGGRSFRYADRVACQSYLGEPITTVPRNGGLQRVGLFLFVCQQLERISELTSHLIKKVLPAAS